MNCIFYAFHWHLDWLGIKTTQLDWKTYLLIKGVTHGSQPQMTRGSMTPFIYGALCKYHNLGMTIQHRYWTKAHYLADVDNTIQRLIVQSTDYGEEVEKFTLYPAIDLDILSHHASFEAMPQRNYDPGRGRPWKANPGTVLSIQLFKK